MISLDDTIWKDLIGGYGTEYDASVALKALEEAESEENEKAVLDELWLELHHQGDVGEASYAAVPHLLRIAQIKPRLNWNYFAQIAVIEISRQQNKNPPLPDFLAEDYQNALSQVGIIAFGHPNKHWDEILMSQVFAAIAAGKGHLTMSQAYLEMTETKLAKAFLDEVIFS